MLSTTICAVDVYYVKIEQKQLITVTFCTVQNIDIIDHHYNIYILIQSSKAEL